MERVDDQTGHSPGWLTSTVSTMSDYLDQSDLANATDSPKGSRPVTFDRDVRIVSLWFLFVLGLFGNMCVFMWLWMNRRRKSRVNKIIFGLATADLCVCFFTILGSALFEMLYYQWLAGNFMCKVVMYMQTVSIMASSNMLVLIAIDRHQAVRSPLKEGLPAWRMVMAAWGFALLLSVPQLFIWRQKRHGDIQTCGTDFKLRPDWHRMAYLSYAAVVTFFIPIMIISVAYARICKKIWDKAHDTSFGRRPVGDFVQRGGKMRIQSTGSTSLNRAKSKTLKMSFVIILAFVICGLPYFIVEIMKCYKVYNIHRFVYGLLGIFAASNSSANPYIFLLFNRGKYGRWADCSTGFYSGIRRLNRRHTEFDAPRADTSSSNSHFETMKTIVDSNASFKGRNGTVPNRNIYKPVPQIREHKV
ncbi:gonadotropin-releasing hormone II receptor-like [Strongylocentrotus purpuratus]|uniref:G-protein coupled receptors family 1 profile domain-containing protein n=1 Tax=Strongylocentrotus purpuratus TaxID=7668 RepID=A0A7M7N9T3_STRPU|nr:gonadotropin-releasing hormone II receptor-like [Strongylocentrotus purpuratus]